MNRAIVMSLKGRRAVVLVPGGRFVQVPRRPDYRVGDEIEMDSAADGEIGERRRKRTRLLRTAGAALAACAIVVAAAGIWTWKTPSVVAYVTMDVNPSVEFGVDSKERVRELRALNPDARPIVASIRYKGEDVEEVTADVAAELAKRHLLNGSDSEIVLASVVVRAVGDSWEDEVTDKMKRAIEQAGAASRTGVGNEPTSPPDDPSDDPESSPSAAPGNDPNQESSSGDGDDTAGGLPQITTISVPEAIREEAMAKGVSAGKLAFWLKAESQGHDVSLEELRKVSLKKIAESWGGVKKVLESDADKTAKDKEEWNRLLDAARAQEERSGMEGKKDDKNGNKGKNDNTHENGNKDKNDVSGKGNAGKVGNAGKGDDGKGDDSPVRANGRPGEPGRKPEASSGTKNNGKPDKNEGRNVPGGGARGNGSKNSGKPERGTEKPDKKKNENENASYTPATGWGVGSGKSGDTRFSLSWNNGFGYGQSKGNDSGDSGEALSNRWNEAKNATNGYEPSLWNNWYDSKKAKTDEEKSSNRDKGEQKGGGDNSGSSRSSDGQGKNRESKKK